jgi:hypothetical protein
VVRDEASISATPHTTYARIGLSIGPRFKWYSNGSLLGGWGILGECFADRLWCRGVVSDCQERFEHEDESIRFWMRRRKKDSSKTWNWDQSRGCCRAGPGSASGRSLCRHRQTPISHRPNLNTSTTTHACLKVSVRKQHDIPIQHPQLRALFGLSSPRDLSSPTASAYDIAVRDQFPHYLRSDATFPSSLPQAR